MLVRTVYLTLLIAICSCSKDPVMEPLVGSVSFSVDGTSYNWIQHYGGSDHMSMYIYTVPPDLHILYISNQTSFNLLPVRTVSLTIQADTLNTNVPYTYTNVTLPEPLYPPHYISVSNIEEYDPFNFYNASEIGDFATVTITRIHDQRVDGSFVAKLRRANDLSVIKIVEGTFKNIEIY